MIFSIKKLTSAEKAICKKTLSPKAFFALVGDAIVRKQSLSVVRMGDGEYYILKAEGTKTFNTFEEKDAGWNTRLGVEDML